MNSRGTRRRPRRNSEPWHTPSSKRCQGTRRCSRDCSSVAVLQIFSDEPYRVPQRSHPALEYLPLTADALRRAAEFWALARQGGYPTAPDPALDADVIFAAQAATLGAPAVVATGNVAHL